ncbi:unnamed protein product [marine sediment metagenome]|uniref:Uncharacterized protein n=1 Tax=marine sediment metagenome TaxID=412755 RepID=X1T2W7_9ZZZZ
MEELTIKGNKPLRSKLLPYGHQCLDDDDIASVVEVLKGDWITQGPRVDEFEKGIFTLLEQPFLIFSFGCCVYYQHIIIIFVQNGSDSKETKGWVCTIGEDVFRFYQHNFLAHFIYLSNSH